MKFNRSAEEEADFLGSQYAYKTGYDPNAAVTFFEKMQARETAKPGTISSLFSSHPPTAARIEKTQRNIARVLPERDRYVLTTSEFLDVQQLLIDYENRRPVDDEDNSRPSLRRRTAASPDSGDDDADEEIITSGEDERPRLERRDDNDPDREPIEDDRPVLRRRSRD